MVMVKNALTLMNAMKVHHIVHQLPNVVIFSVSTNVYVNHQRLVMVATADGLLKMKRARSANDAITMLTVLTTKLASVILATTEMDFSVSFFNQSQI